MKSAVLTVACKKISGFKLSQKSLKINPYYVVRKLKMLRSW